MILGSHNSWSYLPPRRWWMRPFAFMAKCQDADIKTQYEKYGVRCFDLRLKYDGTKMVVAHGKMVYKITIEELCDTLEWLNQKKDVYVRVIHEIRTAKERTETNFKPFWHLGNYLRTHFLNIKFWCGRNLYNWEVDCVFAYNPSCEEKYSSVCKPKGIDDWWPRIYAWFNNKKIREEGTDKDILLIDFVNYK